MHRAVPGSASPDSRRWEPPEVGGMAREAPRIHRQSGSMGVPRSHTRTELCQAQPLPAEEGETPRRGIAAPGGVGSMGKHPGCILDP